MIGKPLSLYELNQNVKQTIKKSFSASVWIVAEISDISENRNGHCYLELVEKGDDDKIIARSRATIWAYTYRMIKPYFETSTGQKLCVGLKVLINVSVDFHEVYSISLNVKNIEPSFTIGELEKLKNETIKRLTDEGVIEMNQSLELPLVIQKIAIVSSETAAGYEDFMIQLNNNGFGYKFYHKLFPAIMQGNDAVESVIKAFDRIFDYEDFFDAVIILRGGGSQVDLNCFNNYWLAYHITQFPLPVLTGIGHERDDSVVDLVSNTRLKTPTAVAEFVVSWNANYEDNLTDMFSQIMNYIENVTNEENYKLDIFKKQIQSNAKFLLSKQNELLELTTEKLIKYVSLFMLSEKQKMQGNAIKYKYLFKNIIKSRENKLLSIKEKIISYSKVLLKNERNKLDSSQRKINLVDPINVLNRGYTLTYKNNKIVKSIDELENNDHLLTRYKNGKTESVVVKKLD